MYYYYYCYYYYHHCIATKRRIFYIRVLLVFHLLTPFVLSFFTCFLYPAVSSSSSASTIAIRYIALITSNELYFLLPMDRADFLLRAAAAAAAAPTPTPTPTDDDDSDEYVDEYDFAPTA